jgi:hypothetical protein
MCPPPADRDIGPETGRDTQCAIIKRGVAPDQQRHALRLGMRGDRRLPTCGDCVMPVIDPRQIGGIGRVADRHLEGRNDGIAIGQHLGTDALAQFGQIGLVRPLAGDQDQIGAIERPDCLQGQMFGVAGADADQKKFHA